MNSSGINMEFTTFPINYQALTLLFPISNGTRRHLEMLLIASLHQ